MHIVFNVSSACDQRSCDLSERGGQRHPTTAHKPAPFSTKSLSFIILVCFLQKFGDPMPLGLFFNLSEQILNGGRSIIDALRQAHRRCDTLDLVCRSPRSHYQHRLHSQQFPQHFHRVLLDRTSAISAKARCPRLVLLPIRTALHNL